MIADMGTYLLEVWLREKLSKSVNRRVGENLLNDSL